MSKFKAGDKVRVIGNKAGHLYKIGDTAFLEKFTEGRFWKTQKGRFYDVYESDIEPYADKQDNLAEQSEEPVKLYCVADIWRGTFCTKGKVYEFCSEGRIIWDDGCESEKYTSLHDLFEQNPTFKANLFPLVKRPAKVGEWVYVTGNEVGVNVGNITPVIRENHLEEGAVYVKADYKTVYGVPDDGNVTLLRTIFNKYLVLDGYQPEDEYEWIDGVKGFDKDLKCRGYQYEIGRTESLAEGEEEKNGACGGVGNGFHFCTTKEDVLKHTFYDSDSSRYCKVRGYVKKGSTGPVYCAKKLEVLEEIESKFYSGKVVCICSDSYVFTVGKPYQYVNGYVTCDDGRQYNFIAAETKEAALNRPFVTFIEYKGEQP